MKYPRKFGLLISSAVLAVVMYGHCFFTALQDVSF